MHLTKPDLANAAVWQAAGISLPQFDLDAVTAATKAAPRWIHFGAGNIFKVFPAAVQQQLLEAGIETTGIIIAEGYDYEIIDAVCAPYDNLTLAVTLKADGTIEKSVVASIVESLKADSANETDFNRLREIFRAPSLQMASFTITEKGYSLIGAGGALLPDVEADFAAGPSQAKSYIGKLAALCHERYRAGALPLALVSMDNCSHNGTRLHDAVTAFAREWESRGLCDAGFLAYLENPALISFPWSMIDKITPRPDDSVKAMLRECGFEDVDGAVTAKNTYVAPFVNAEETQYLVIEDHFPNGRPQLEEGGVIFTARETVDKVEKMKVCTCLNPLHTALAIFGCLLGYNRISDEMRDADLVRLIESVGYKEGLPVVVNPGILDPRAFIDTVLQQRLPNPFMPDTPQRIATDTSQKLPVRFGETIKAYRDRDDLDSATLDTIPLVLAGWLRYLLGIDDNGVPFAPSSDPRLAEMQDKLAPLTLGGLDDCHEILQPILRDTSLFAVDLYAVGLGEKVERYFRQLAAGPGAVRATLTAHIG